MTPRPGRPKTRHVLSLAVVMLVAASGQVLDPSALAQTTAPAAPKRPVYVREFAFAAPPKQEESLLPQGPVRRRLQGRSEDPAEHARKLAELLSKTIVEHLTEAGFPASRLQPGAVPPNDGWLIGGEFLEVDEGNRLRRAVVGFGAGGADVKVEVEIYDLAKDPSYPVLVYGASDASRKTPGGIITKNPYAIAAKYVMSRKATEKEVEKLGKQIAADLVKISSSDPVP